MEDVRFWVMTSSALPISFYDRSTLVVARELLGCHIHLDEVVLRIVETEAYLPNDTACHAFRGRTPRNEPMWGPPGYAYVYLCYGIHTLLNFVTEREGVAAAVLIRGCEVVEGHEVVTSRRGGRRDLIGPGKVGQALALDTSWTGRPLQGPLLVSRGSPPTQVEAKPRVGIDYAEPADRDAPWRFLARG